MTPHEEQGRRREDQIDYRVVQLEKNYLDMHQSVLDLKSSMGLLEVGQKHQAELLDYRFRSLENVQALLMSKVDSIDKGIQSMASDVTKSPAGRELKAELETVTASVVSLTTWKSNVDGILNVMKFLGPMGLVAFLLALARLAGLLK